MTEATSPRPAPAVKAEPRVCPECRNGKHDNCTGWALDEATDDVVDCECPDESHPPRLASV